MKKINLILGTHNHQPIGNFDFVFSDAFDHSYQPFLDLLAKYPKVKIAQHYTGILLDWLRANRPRFLRQLQRLVKKGQVEMVGGAYYEAILTVIPDDDKRSQLEKLSRSLKREFGTRPQGMWLAERVWEQHLTSYIADAGLRYIVIDDTHFKYAGFAEEELLGYYVTEEQGRTVSIFPISKYLRYTIPFQPVRKTIDYLRSLASEEGDRIVVFADDGEKFGVWPKTYNHVYTKGWLEEFLKALTDNSDWINILHFTEAMQKVQPIGRTYLPNASYAEMMHWALPAHHVTLYDEFEAFLKKQGVLERYESFFKGGFWRNFLVKYPETNTMHKKMMRVSARAHRIEAGRKHVGNRTWERIFAAQCNDPYWHGVFGGLYLPVLRYPIYHNLIAAERDMDRLEKKRTVSVELTDFDCDGNKELLVETPILNCYFNPREGGSLFELDFKPISLNLLDGVSRREEGYHHKLAQASSGKGGEVASIHDLVLAKEEGLEKHLNYDWYRHGSLIDHFFAGSATVETFWQCTYGEEGDFVNRPYEASVRKSGRSTAVELRRKGRIRRNGTPHKIEVRKRILFNASESDLHIEYRIVNEEDRPIDLWFGCEFTLALQAGNAPDRYYYSPGTDIRERELRSKGALEGVALLGLRDEWLGVDVQIDVGEPATFWRIPVETISLSESGFERIYQSSVVVPHWKIHLEREWRKTLTHRVRRLNKKG